MESGGEDNPNSKNSADKKIVRTGIKSRLLTRSHAVYDESPTDSKKKNFVYYNSAVDESQIDNLNFNQINISRESTEEPPSSEKSYHVPGSQSVQGSAATQSQEELLQFIIETMNKSQKDKNVILRIESDLVNFIKDTKRTTLPFPQMTSYQRMLVHRISAYYNLEHNLDSQTGNCVIVSKCKETKLPEFRFRDYVKKEEVAADKKILKRENTKPTENMPKNQVIKSFEEKASDYNKARSRIFNNDEGAHEGRPGGHPQGQRTVEWNHHSNPQAHQRLWSSTDSDNSIGNSLRPPTRLLKVESFETQRSIKNPPVAKSFSFGGYQSSGHNRLFNKQDSSSSSSGLSPASSGYKSAQSLDLIDRGKLKPTPQQEEPLIIISNPPSLSTTPINDNYDNHQPTPVENNQVVFWAVTDMSNVPPGSIIIDPNSGQTLKNIDGSVYHFDPLNPPKPMHPHHEQPMPVIQENNHAATNQINYQTVFVPIESNPPELYGNYAGTSYSQHTHDLEGYYKAGWMPPPPQAAHPPSNQPLGCHGYYMLNNIVQPNNSSLNNYRASTPFVVPQQQFVTSQNVSQGPKIMKDFPYAPNQPTFSLSYVHNTQQPFYFQPTSLPTYNNQQVAHQPLPPPPPMMGATATTLSQITGQSPAINLLTPTPMAGPPSQQPMATQIAPSHIAPSHIAGPLLSYGTPIGGYNGFQLLGAPILHQAPNAGPNPRFHLPRNYTWRQSKPRNNFRKYNTLE